MSNTAAHGPVGNPYDQTRSAGGSTSGCAVLLVLGEADMAIGGDQGGSIRIVRRDITKSTIAEAAIIAFIPLWASRAQAHFRLGSVYRHHL